MIKEHSAGAVLYRYFSNDERKFLLLHYTSGHWDFPKGNLEAGETEVDAVIREIFEETGITDLKFVEGFIQPIFYNYRRDGNLVQKKVSFYLAQTPAINIKLSDEHQDFFWSNYPSALTTLTYRSARDTLISANKYLNDRQTV
jgi:bis(5'-nucleosidyl)-tetraphosphatase